MSKSPYRPWFLVCALALAVTAPANFAALPPAYLGVKDFDRCLAEKDMGSYRAWCLPAARPAACPEASWEQLKALSGPDRVPGC